MQSRREFLKSSAMLSGALGMGATLNESIERALAIEPEPLSTYLDAEHVVILMQENRSFDHCFGTLAGVRGFNDPRAVMLRSNIPVWVQTNAAGESYAPWRLNIHESNSTWTGCLPHTWPSQVDARNGGHHDGWLDAKRPAGKKYGDLPLTLGYYTRDDIPFHYALADAFTVCDQHFCSSLTPTSPNRLHLWTGTIRQGGLPDAPACVRNEQAEHLHPPAWTTFPERLEEHGISWKIYQNEVTQRSGFTEEQELWLSNFGDNPMEYFSQYHVKFTKGHRDYLQKQVQTLEAELQAMKVQVAVDGIPPGEAANLKERLATLTAAYETTVIERDRWTVGNFEKLPLRERNLHEKAFFNNAGDPSFRELAELAYRDGDTEHKIPVPKGDVLYQFRKDVQEGKLPTVSWLVAPAKLSDHPDGPWFGAWYCSEALGILSQNPDLWRKTIFILTYDENDGYFDHVPPFVAPAPGKPETGIVSNGIDTDGEYVTLEQDLSQSHSGPRESPIGLGYRVPMVVASPWSRGGCVCSQVFDHTSVLQFLEKLISHKTGKPIEETNISRWRRTVSGDLTSVFQPAAAKESSNPPSIPRDAFFEQIDRAKLKPSPSGFTRLSDEMIAQIRRNPADAKWLPRQEHGIRPSCALPYELLVDGALSDDRARFKIQFHAGKDRFGDRSAGCPFTVYAITAKGTQAIRNYAVIAGDKLEDSWPLHDFADGKYHLIVHGPNGFFREFMGDANDPHVQLRLGDTPGGEVGIRIANRAADNAVTVQISDRSYKAADVKRSISTGETAVLTMDVKRSFYWYDLAVRIEGFDHFEQRFAGRVETGKWSFTDPAMGGVAV